MNNTDRQNQWLRRMMGNILPYHDPEFGYSRGVMRASERFVEGKPVSQTDLRHATSTVFIIAEDTDDEFTPRIVELAESAGHQIRVFENAERFLETYDSSRLGCVFCGVRLAGMSGIELLRRLSERSWDIPVAMMSAGSDVATSVIALKSGAMDFIERQIGELIILDLIHDAIALHKQRRKKRVDVELLKSRLARLTLRECDVMWRVVDGWPNKVVAADLGVSTKTVEAHRSHVMKKMEARSLPDLVRMAMHANQLERA